MSPDPLAQLRDIHLPEPIGWWPPAPGWLVVAFLSLALVGWVGYRLLLSLRNNRYRRAARKELARLRHHPDPGAVLPQVAMLLRRVAIQSFGRREVAALTGRRWLEFLDQTGGGSQFSRGTGSVLGENLYQRHSSAEIEPLLRLADKWIRSHKR